MPGASAVDLKLDADTHDLVFEDGDLVIERDPGEVLAQRVRVRLRTWLGEWYLDAGFGTDYRGTILVKAPQRAAVAAEIKRVIEGTPGVKRLLDLQVEYSAETRTFSITRGVVEGDEGAVEIAG